MKNSQPSQRLDAIDQFRGFAILLMVLANYLAGVISAPAWLKHAPDIGLTITDLIAPFFIFAIGLTYGPSWRRRAARDGRFRAAQHFVTRFLALAGVGAILSAGEIWLKIDGAMVNWGVLQAIGAAGVLTLLVIDLRPGWRLAAGLGLLAAYQALLERAWLADVLHSPHGGLPGSLGWAGMLILATACADLVNDMHRPRGFFLAAGLALGMGLVVAIWFPISKNRVSASYALVSLGASALLFSLFNGFKLKLPLLSTWGRNPLTLYVLHLLLLGLMVLPGIPAWYSQASVWLVCFQALGLLALLSAAGLWLERKGIVISL